MWRAFLAVSIGGVLGCLLRWVLAMAMNRYFPLLPPGTLAANLIAGTQALDTRPLKDRDIFDLLGFD